MGRPKLKKTEKKVKLGITISQEVNDQLKKTTNNKSKFIEELLTKNLIK
jgi:hypothetical protein